MTILFNYLSQYGISFENAFNVIFKMSNKKLAIFIQELNNKIPIDDRPATSIFDYFANNRLSGGPNPCSNLDCRLKNIDILSKISVMYSDRVLIKNPFEEFLYYKTYNEIIKYEIAANISIFYYIKPLLDSRVITIGKSDFHFCPDCYEKIVLKRNEKLEVRVSDVRRFLYEKYLSNCKVYLEEDEHGFFATIKGSKEIFDHPQVIIYKDLPTQISSQLQEKQKIKLSQKHIKNLGIIKSLADPILDDLVVEDYYANLYNTSFLTDRVLDTQIMSLINNSSTNEINKNIYEVFSHAVPFILNTDLDKLATLRIEEGESFKVYRDSLTSLIKKTPEIDQKFLQQAFNDEILPEINKIDLTLKNNKKRFTSKLTRDILVGSCFIGLGLFSGMLPTNIGEIVAALGGFKYVSSISDSISQIIDSSDEARSNKYYFLWKVKEIDRKTL